MQTIIVDGLCWEIEFGGFAAPLRGRLASRRGAPADLEVELRSWSCARHLDTLRRNLQIVNGKLALDGQRYADTLFDEVGTMSKGEDLNPARALLRPLALWWAHGVAPGEAAHDPTPDARGWVHLDLRRTARVRAWTWGERLVAQRTNLHGANGHGAQRDEQLDFDAVGYLEAMLRACTCELHEDGVAGAVTVEQLDAGATRGLTTAVMAINHPNAGTDPLEQLSPAMAGATLRLCTTMGWTPERVLSTPAVEVQRMLSLIERVQGPQKIGGDTREAAPRPRATRRPRLADHPDAVVIHFDHADLEERR